MILPKRHLTNIPKMGYKGIFGYLNFQLNLYWQLTRLFGLLTLKKLLIKYLPRKIQKH